MIPGELVQVRKLRDSLKAAYEDVRAVLNLHVRNCQCFLCRHSRALQDDLNRGLILTYEWQKAEEIRPTSKETPARD